MEPKFFPSIPHLSGKMCITEKLDGTNNVIEILNTDDMCTCLQCIPKGFFSIPNTRLIIRCLSKNNILYPDKERDNYGFCKWVHENLEEISKLGPGSHAGEWWGQGIQRNYGLKEKRFSLFAAHRWICPDMGEFVQGTKNRKPAPICCHVVPMLFYGSFNTDIVDTVLDRLIQNGSYAAPGFMKPEGLIVYHEAAKQLFKKTIEKDGDNHENSKRK